MKKKQKITLAITTVGLTVAIILLCLFADLVGFTGRIPDACTLSPAALQEIKEAYVASVDPTASPDRVKVAESCGTYGDCTVLMLEGVLFYTQAVRTESVGGIRFHYRDGNTLYAYRDGQILPLKEAYEQGMLSRRDVRRARDIHNAYLRG